MEILYADVGYEFEEWKEVIPTGRWRITRYPKGESVLELECKGFLFNRWYSELFLMIGFPINTCTFKCKEV